MTSGGGPGGPAGPGEPGGEWLDDEAGPLVRLYGVTRGRTRPAGKDLDLLAVVVRRGVTPPGTRLGPEHQQILALCQRPLAVVEIGSTLDLPLGVLYVLLADLFEQGLIVIRPPNHDALNPSEPLLEELLHGLQDL